MTSHIDASMPVEGNPTTDSVRSNFAIARDEITALQNATGALPPEAPSDGYPYQRFDGGWQRAAALYPAMFGARADGSDATAALQAGLDAAYNQGLDFVVAGGAYSTTGVSIYSGQTVRFVGGGKLTFTGTGVPCIKSMVAPGVPPGTTQPTITGLALVKPVIDMQGRSGCGILLEDCSWAMIDQPWIMNTGGATWVYSSTKGPTTCPDCCFVFTATGGGGGATQSYYNKVLAPNFLNTGTRRGQGFYFTAPDGASSGFPNYNKVEGGLVTGFNVGVHVYYGSDTMLDNIDVSENNTGYLVADNPSHNVNRTTIVKPYAESCTVGIHLGPYQNRTIVIGGGSFAGTPTPVVEDTPASGTTSAQYLNLDTDFADSANYLADWNVQAGGLWNVVSGAGGHGSSGLAHFAYGTPGLFFGRYNGSPGAKAAMLVSQTLGQIYGLGWDGSSLSTTLNSPDIMFETLENWTAAAHGASINMHAIAPGTLTRTLALVVRALYSIFAAGVGFWNVQPPASQPTGAGNTATAAAGSGTQAFTNTTFTGGIGSTGYTIGDLVRVMKQYGMIAQ